MNATAKSALELSQGVERINELTRMHQGVDALALAHRLLDGIDAAALPADALVAQALNGLGIFLFERAFYREAKAAYTPALALVQRCVPRDDILIGNLHNNLGQAEDKLGGAAAAREHLEAALVLKQSAQVSPLSGAVTMDNLAAVLVGFGELDRAEALHVQALDILERGYGPVHVDVATTLGNLGRLYRQRGDLGRARACLLRSLDTHLRVGGLDSGGALISAVNLVRLCLDNGDDVLANQLTDLLLAVGGDQPREEHHIAAMTILELASSAFAEFQLGLAERLATRSLFLLESTAGPVDPQTLRAVQLLANVHASKGNIEAAERGLMRVLNAPRTDSDVAAQALIDLGKALRARGHGGFGAAITLFEQAIRVLRERADPDPQLLASALGNLGQLHFENDDSVAADALYTQALALIGKRTANSEHAWLLHGRAMLDYHLARHDAAAAGYARAQRLWVRKFGAEHPFVATTQANLALVQWARGDMRGAVRTFSAALRLRERESVRTLAVGTERQRLETARGELGDLYKIVSLALTSREGAAARLAATRLLQHKGGVLDALAQSRSRLRERLDPGSRVLLDRLADTQRRIAEQALSTQLFGSAADARALEPLQAEEERLQSDLSHRSAFGHAALAPVTLAAVRAALPSGATLVEYLRYSVFDPVRTGSGNSFRGERYAAMVLRRRGALRWFDLGAADAIDAEVQALRESLRDPDGDPEPDAEALQRRLIEPLEPLLSGTRLLLIAPDGALNLLPFGVLGQPMLAERFVLSHLVSGRELLHAASDSAPQAVVQVIVDPDFDAIPPDEPDVWVSTAAALSAETGFAPLPGTRSEARAIESLFGNCRVLAGSDATVEALKRVKRPAILHIATHGLFAPNESTEPLWRSETLRVGDQLLFMQRAGPSAYANPMLHAGLVLAGANHGVAGRPRGIVSAAELAELDLCGTELVVLSACDTGLGRAAHGEEFAGLRRAFAIAGAASMIISLWEVEDNAAAALMTAYYRRLLDGVDRAAALQQAQHEVRRRPRWAHPAYWAAFVAWGAPGPLPASLRSVAPKETT